jgi:4-hydroxy-tetrahydrodipicolinate synthase
VPQNPPLQLTGIVPIAVTPFYEQDAVDFDSFQKLVLDYHAGAVSGIVVPAVASEVDKLTPTERIELVRNTVEVLAGRLPVIGGVLGDTPDEAARLAEEALRCGCAGILCRAPASLSEDKVALRRYFGEVAAVGADYLVIQDLSWNDYGMDLGLIFDLFESIEAFRTIKIEVARTGYKASRILEDTGGRLNVWSGWAMPQMIESLQRGIDGYCPSAFNRPFVRVFELFLEGHTQEAEEIFEKVLPYLAWSRQHIDINLHLLKRLCVRKGLFKTPRLRKPFVEYDSYHEAYGAGLIERMLEWEKA